MKYKFLATLIVLFLNPLVSLASGSISINEIMYDLDGTDTDREWVEILNNSSSDVDLTGWKFNDGTNHNLLVPPGNGGIGDLIISSGEYAVLASDAMTFLVDYPSYTGTLIDTVMSLTNTSKTLKIIDKDAVEVDSVTYNSDQGGNDNGASLQKNSQSNWIQSLPTPGLVNSETIFVADTGSGTGDGSGTSSTTATSTDSGASGGTTGGSSSGSSSGGSSVHSSYVSVSNDTPKVALEVSAGRDRLLNLGNSLELRAKVTKGEPSGVRYVWSFGDGTAALGEVVSHSYSLPGTYQIVLNATSGSEEAVSRTTVKVVESGVSISEVNTMAGFLNLFNQSSVEANLGGWKIKQGDQTFTFPRDTIISPNAKLPVAFSVINFGASSDNPFVLQDISGRQLSEFSQTKGRILAIEDQKQLDLLNQELAVLMEQAKNQVVASSETQVRESFTSAPLLPVDSIVLAPVAKKELPTISTTTNTDQLANVATIVIAKPESRVFGFLNWPINFIKQLFN